MSRLDSPFGLRENFNPDPLTAEMPDFAPSSLSPEEMQDLLHRPFERTAKGQRAAVHGFHDLPDAMQSLLRRFTGFTPLELLVDEGEFGGKAVQLAAELLERGLIRPKH